jgi:hypothetical protein
MVGVGLNSMPRRIDLTKRIKNKPKSKGKKYKTIFYPSFLIS